MFTPIETQNISPDVSRTLRTEISYQFLKRDFFFNFNFLLICPLSCGKYRFPEECFPSLYKPADQSRSAVDLNLN